MSDAKAPAPRRQAISDSAARKEGKKNDAASAKPLKPRPRLFYVMCALFVLWAAFLAVLYFKTVYPHRADETPSDHPAAPN